MTHKTLSAVDLASAARRRALSLEEDQQLQADLARDPVEAALFSAGRAFDAQGVSSDGDEALAFRLAEYALSDPRPRTAPFAEVSRIRSASRASLARPRKRGVLLGAAVGFAAAAAAAAGGYVVLRRPALPVVEAPRSAAQAALPSKQAAARSLPTLLPKASDVPVEAESAEEAPKAVSAEPGPEKEPRPLSAELLFSRANAERRAGRSAEAMASYDQLLSRFPGSSEAQIARVSLANVLLTQGSAARALSLFNSHLSRGSQLAEEALYGKARALSALGKPAEERKVWQTLAAQYPNSIYARSARERLSQSP